MFAESQPGGTDSAEVTVMFERSILLECFRVRREIRRRGLWGARPVVYLSRFLLGLSLENAAV